MWIARPVLLVAALLASANSPAASDTIDRETIVYISARCIDQTSGGIIAPQGSGVIIDQFGYVVTAHHVLRCWLGQNDVDRANYPLEGRIGSKFNDTKFLSYIRSDEVSDFAILKIEGTGEYAHASSCVLRVPEPGVTRLVAAGFPRDQEYQATDLRFGNSVANLWGVSGEMTDGMSGGGVFLDGRLVGIVKGGDPDASNTLNRVSPIFRFSVDLERETGVGELRSCENSDPSGGRAGGDGPRRVSMSTRLLPRRPNAWSRRPSMPPALPRFRRAKAT